MNPLMKRINRYEATWIEGRLLPDDHDAVEKVIYAQDKLIAVLVDACKRGELTQDQVEAQIACSTQRVECEVRNRLKDKAHG